MRMAEAQDNSGIEKPLIVDDPDAVAWARQADVVVVGFGGAGATAALQAAEQGADVIALDRFAGGGATRFSGGVNYAGGGTSIQQEAGVTDSVEEMTKYLMLEVGDVVRPQTVRNYSEQSGPSLEWLRKLGVPYKGTLYKEKIVYPPDGYYLQYSGNEKVPEYASRAVPAARGHRAVGTGLSGYAMYDAMLAAAHKLGVKLIPHSPVVRLVQDRQGKIIGVETRALPERLWAKHSRFYQRVNPSKPFNAKTALKAGRAAAAMEQAEGAPQLIRARRGVVLSTGGFAHNLSMLERHAPFFARHIGAVMRMNSLGCTGAGIRLGESVGGVARGLDRLYIGRNMAPPNPFLKGIMVNAKGERFVNEAAYNSIIGRAIFEQPGGQAHLIITRANERKSIRQCLFSGLSVFLFFGLPAVLNILFGGTKRAGTIKGLAEKCAMDPQVLQATVDRYNQTIGSADDLGKPPELRQPIADRGYTAINFSITNKFAFTQIFTLGGLVVDEETGQALRADGTPITGLYAAGRTAFGLCSHNYISGLSIGDCVFTGRRAARNCMAENQPARAKALG
jgi:3-oxo-5alpha-steroid 4-dehydrogenase